MVFIKYDAVEVIVNNDEMITDIKPEHYNISINDIISVKCSSVIKIKDNIDYYEVDEIVKMIYDENMKNVEKYTEEKY